MRAPRRILTILIGFALYASPALAQASSALRPCRDLQVSAADAALTAQVPTNSIGCRTGGRISGRDFSIVHCAGQETVDGTLGINRLIVKKHGGRTQVVDAQNQSPTLNAMSMYEVDLGDSRSREYVLALWDSQSNGMGINNWTLVVLTSELQHLETIPNVADFGLNNFVRSPNGCALAITSFAQGVRASEPNAWYFKARFTRLRGGNIVRAEGIAPRQRRYTGAFERQRIASFDRRSGFPKSGNAVVWLNDRR